MYMDIYLYYIYIYIYIFIYIYISIYMQHPAPPLKPTVSLEYPL
jgi:hypothetical protein